MQQLWIESIKVSTFLEILTFLINYMGSVFGRIFLPDKRMILTQKKEMLYTPHAWVVPRGAAPARCAWWGYWFLRFLAEHAFLNKSGIFCSEGSTQVSVCPIQTSTYIKSNHLGIVSEKQPWNFVMFKRVWLCFFPREFWSGLCWFCFQPSVQTFPKLCWRS